MGRDIGRETDAGAVALCPLTPIPLPEAPPQPRSTCDAATLILNMSFSKSKPVSRSAAPP
eukprot:3510925-Pleurochrysis_carterae.AAC.1